MLKCSSITIKFIEKNVPKQEISAISVTGSYRLEVHRDNHFLVVTHKSEKGYSLKQLNFSLSDIKEYVCDGIDNSFLVPKGPTTLPHLECIK